MHELASFNRHRFRHGQNQAVALDGANQGQADAGIARGRFDNDRVLVKQSFFLCILDHGQRNTILDTAAGIETLHLHPHLDVITEKAIQFNVRRVADRLQNVVEFHICYPEC